MTHGGINMTKYTLVSQGIKILETFDKKLLCEILNEGFCDYELFEEDISLSLTIEEIKDMCYQDRFALIIPQSIYQYISDRVDELMQKSKVTGILVERSGNVKMYHSLSRKHLEGTLQNGIRPSNRENMNLTYGGGVIYAYPSVTHFTNPSCLIEIDYNGPYLEALCTQDKEEKEQGECLLYPAFIQGISEYILPKNTTEF